METNQKKNKTIDYEKLYRNNYKNLPNAYYLVIRILLTLGAVITGIVFMAEGDADFIAYGILTLIGGFFVAWGIAALTRFTISVAMSQSVVVADSLLALKDGNTTSALIDDELPEL